MTPSPFKIIQPKTPPVKNCPRGFVCGWTYQPMLRDVKI